MFDQHAVAPPTSPTNSELSDAVESGRLLMRAGQWEAAQAHFLALVQQYPHTAALHLHLGAILNRSGEPREALTAFFTASRLEPETAIYWYHLGQACRRAGKIGQAAQALSRALHLNPEYPEAQLALAETQTQLDAGLLRGLANLEHAREARDYPGLVHAAREIESLDQDHPAALLVLADADERTGHILEAVGHLLRLLQTAPDHASARRRLERLQQEHGPDLPLRYWKSLASRFLRQKQYEAAFEAAENARLAAPGNGDVCLWHGNLLELAGKVRAAQSAYLSAAEFKDTCEAANFALARLRRKELAERRQRVGTYLREALDYRNNGQFESALASLAQAEPTLRDDPLLFLLKATIHERKGNLHQAVLSAESAVKLDTSHESTAIYLRNLRRRRDEELTLLVEDYLNSGLEHLHNQEWIQARNDFELARQRWEDRHAQTQHPLHPLPLSNIQDSLRQQELEALKGCICTSLALGAIRPAAELATALANSQPEHPIVGELVRLTGTMLKHGMNQAVLQNQVLALLHPGMEHAPELETAGV